jgi:hypothetical protein
MSFLPPASEVLEVLRLAVLPALGVAGVVCAVVWRLAPKRGAAVGAALALALGVLAGNYFREAVAFRLEPDRPLTLSDLRVSATHALKRQPAAQGPAAEEAAPTSPPTWYWLPWSAGLALLAGLGARLPKLPLTVAWALRLLAVFIVARLLVPAEVAGGAAWPVLLFAAVVLFQWGLLEQLARQAPGGWLPLGLSGVSFAAAVVLLHAHSARLTDLATLLCAALAGIAVVGWVLGRDPGGAMPAVAVALPGLLLIGQQETFSELPWTSFALVALAPLALSPLVLPWLNRLRGWGLVVIVLALLLVPAVAGVALAAQAEPLSFD